MLNFPFGFIWLYLSATVGSHYAFPCVSRNLSNIWDLCCWKLLSCYPSQLSFLIKWIELLSVSHSKEFSPLHLVFFVILSSTIYKYFLATFEKRIWESISSLTSLSCNLKLWATFSIPLHATKDCIRHYWLNPSLKAQSVSSLLRNSYSFCVCAVLFCSCCTETPSLPYSFPPTAGW